MDMIFTSKIDVQLIDHMGDDTALAHAAWVSTQGQMAEAKNDPARVNGLLKFLMREDHLSPFEHGTLKFLVHAPIFVWRQHHRHRSFSYNEESGRYKTLDPVFYIADQARTQTGKPGAYLMEPGTDEQSRKMRATIEIVSRTSYHAYEYMLELGISGELARTLLPLNIYSSCYVTCNPRSLMHFLYLRDEFSSAQKEIQMVADQYANFFKDLFPMTYEAFRALGEGAS